MNIKCFFGRHSEYISHEGRVENIQNKMVYTARIKTCYGCGKQHGYIVKDYGNTSCSVEYLLANKLVDKLDLASEQLPVIFSQICDQVGQQKEL